MRQTIEPPVVDTSPFIILAEGGLLDLLKVQSERVCLPRMVEVEVLRHATSDAAAEALRTESWLNVVDPGPIPERVGRLRLDAGEEAVLAWALSHPGTVAIIDDRLGRRAANHLGIPVIGLLGLIVDAKLRGVIPAARLVVDHLLRTTDWYLSRELRERVLSQIGE